MLTVIHDQLPIDANTELFGGWPMILSGLKTLIETGELLDTPGSLRYAEGAAKGRRTSTDFHSDARSQMATQTQIVNGVDFVALPTKDWEASRKFYEEVLGLPSGKQWGDMPAGEFETGSLTVAVMQVDAFGIDFAPHTLPIEFHVDDFEAAKAELESRGVEFQGDVIDSGVCKQAFFSDLDGNRLAIHHRYAAKDATP
jgi:catechol 2,3-dioxygenase-like lactoylglutathione lyase family enzyme